ncbi:MAG: hypothetical protein EBR30_08980 [Cytophagia bacterium]|nr:hypothetical protein [Cytophagia bacterium]
MINLSKTQVSWDSQVIAFRWYMNIGDPLSHFAHFASFLSETQRQEALDIIRMFQSPSLANEELAILQSNVEIAPIKADKPTIAKVNL